jgi:arylamine N-acetyltransferase
VVTLASGDKYMIDASYGGDGPTKPLPLIEGVITPNLGTQEVRLYYDHPSVITDKSQPKLWIYQYRNANDKDWNSCYCFPELEFSLDDLVVMSYYASSNPDSSQPHVVLMVKFLKREGQDHVYGKVMLIDSEVKMNEGGKTKVVQLCRTEEERVKAFKEWFGIDLTEEERCGIFGRSTRLKGIEASCMKNASHEMI